MGKDSIATEVNGDEDNNSAAESGAASVFTFAGVQPSFLDSWRTTHFGSAANSGDGADFADSDMDRLVNLMEFATGQDATISSAGPLRIERDGNDRAFVSVLLPLLSPHPARSATRD